MVGPWRRALLAEARCSTLEGQLAEAHKVIRDLTAMVGELKREGFAAPPKFEGEIASDDLPDEVLNAMSERAQPNTTAWNRLAGEARKMMRTAGDADAVARKILEGEPEAFSWGA